MTEVQRRGMLDRFNEWRESAAPSYLSLQKKIDEINSAKGVTFEGERYSIAAHFCGDRFSRIMVARITPTDKDEWTKTFGEKAGSLGVVAIATFINRHKIFYLPERNGDEEPEISVRSGRTIFDPMGRLIQEGYDTVFDLSVSPDSAGMFLTAPYTAIGPYVRVPHAQRRSRKQIDRILSDSSKLPEMTSTQYAQPFRSSTI